MKTNITTTLFTTVGLLSACLFLFSFAFVVQNSDWKVPDEAKKMQNPTKANKENLAIGKTIYAKHCRSCHGKNGEGDGTKAEELETFAGDFTLEEFKAVSDGEMYYKITEGRDDMPGFKKKIASDEDRWLLVHYLRTFEAE